MQLELRKSSDYRITQTMQFRTYRVTVYREKVECADILKLELLFRDLVFAFQSDVKSRDSKLLKLGLLQGDMSPQKADTGIRKQSNWMTFHHAIFINYLIAFYIKKQGKVK